MATGVEVTKVWKGRRSRGEREGRGGCRCRLKPCTSQFTSFRAAAVVSLPLFVWITPPADPAQRPAARPRSAIGGARHPRRSQMGTRWTVSAQRALEQAGVQAGAWIDKFVARTELQSDVGKVHVWLYV